MNTLDWIILVASLLFPLTGWLLIARVLRPRRRLEIAMACFGTGMLFNLTVLALSR